MLVEAPEWEPIERELVVLLAIFLFWRTSGRQKELFMLHLRRITTKFSGMIEKDRSSSVL